MKAYPQKGPRTTSDGNPGPPPGRKRSPSGKGLFVPVLLLLPLILASPTFSGEPPQEPILRLETGMHTAMITRIGTDAQNRYLVTASLDKTVRVWELASGRLLATLRPPIGEGHEGKIYAVALSPDGRRVACGGWTGWDWEGKDSIYLFDRETGDLIVRIPGLPNVIDHLTYSRDGRFLVAALYEGGLRVYRTRDWGLEFEDKDYGDQSYGADFDRQGRLVASCFDGSLRLYDPQFKRIARERARGGSKPHSVAFSPDGSKIAVGFDDSTQVDVLSGKDLSYLYSPEPSHAGNGNLMAVSWSSDGQSLYAGGMYGKEGACPILQWPQEGKGSPKELAGAKNTILHLFPLKEGGILFGAGDPAWGRIDVQGKQAWFRGPAIADLRGSLRGFLLSRDGTAVQFGYELGGESPARFSLPDRLLEPLDAQGSAVKAQALSPPLTEGLAITEWKNSPSPKLDGVPLKLWPYERSRSLALYPDRSAFLLGCEWSLRLLDPKGKEKWSLPVPSVAWGVNISGDGRLVVAAFADGTIRWYRIEDGKELLALFPHSDRKRWVAWTPQGYYDASPGAEELIGWHINYGKEKAADFFPVSRFREVYCRPDVIAKVLQTLDEREALRLANQESGGKRREREIQRMLPPVVRVLSPAEGSEVRSSRVTVKFQVRSPSGDPVTGIQALVDGRPEARQSDLRLEAKEMEREIQVSLPEQDCAISIIAENANGASEAATVRVKWAGRTEEPLRKPALYVLAVGVSEYEDASLREGVKHAAQDAKAFADAISKQKGVLYRDVIVKELTDKTATRDEVLDGLAWIERETTAYDVAMIFLAGHGVNDPNGLYYFLPVNGSTEKLKRTAVSHEAIKGTVKYLACKVLLFVDTCHSGNIMGPGRGVADIASVVNDLISAENGVVVFASSTGRQTSVEVGGSGAFTKALVEGIQGAAAPKGKGKITVDMLGIYISERVKELTKGRQTPTPIRPDPVPDFPVAYVME